MVCGFRRLWAIAVSATCAKCLAEVNVNSAPIYLPAIRMGKKKTITMDIMEILQILGIISIVGQNNVNDGIPDG